MAKAKKGLLLSVLALLFAVTLAATSTYAWFVVNTEVTASNMQVTVKSDTTYLVISNSSTLGTDTSLALTAANPKDVLPVKYDASVTPGTGESKWQTASGTSYTNGAASTAGYSNVATANLGNYLVSYTFYIGTTNTTAQTATNLKVKDLNVTNTAESNPDNTFLNAVSVAFEYDGAIVANCTNNNGITSLDRAACNAFGTLVASLTPGTAYEITAHVYINGDNPVVKSENAANIATFAVEAIFEVTAG